MHPILDTEAHSALVNFQLALRKQKTATETLRVKLQSVGEETMETLKHALSEDPLHSFFLIDDIQAIETNPNRNKFTMLLNGDEREVTPPWRCMATVEIKEDIISLEVTDGLGCSEHPGQKVQRSFTDGGIIAELLTDELFRKLLPAQTRYLNELTARLTELSNHTQAKTREIRSTKEIMLCNVLDHKRRSIAMLQSIEPRRLEEWNDLLESANDAFADMLNQDGFHWENRTPALEEAFKAGLPNFIAAFTNSKLQMVAVRPPASNKMTDFHWESPT